MVQITRRVASGADDSEERVSDGAIELTSSDLELGTEPFAGEQIVGVRFADVTIPPGATIDSAFIQFTEDEQSSSSLTLEIFGEAADDAAQYTTSNSDLSNRSLTSASVQWSPDPWSGGFGTAGAAQRTPDIAAVIQEVVDRPGWQSGNALSILIYPVSASGVRTAVAYEDEPDDAAELIVDYSEAAVELDGSAGIEFAGAANLTVGKPLAGASALTITAAAELTVVSTGVQYRSHTLFASGASTIGAFDAEVPADAEIGDLLLIAIHTDAAGSLSSIDPDLTLLRSDSGTDIRQEIYWRIIDGTEPDEYSFTSNANRYFVVSATVFSGVDPNNPIDAHNGQYNSPSSNVVAPSVTTTVDNTLLLFYGAIRGGEATFTPPAGMTEVYDAMAGPGVDENGRVGTLALEVRPTAGATGTRTAVATQSDDSAAALVALRPLVVGPTELAGESSLSFDATAELSVLKSLAGVTLIQMAASGQLTPSGLSVPLAGLLGLWYAGDGQTRPPEVTVSDGRVVEAQSLFVGGPRMHADAFGLRPDYLLSSEALAGRGAFRFDGTKTLDDDVGGLAANLTEYTIVAVFVTTSDVDFGTLYAEGNTGSNTPNLALRVNQDAPGAAAYSQRANDQTSAFVSAAAGVNDGQPHLLIAQRRGASDWRLRLDGVEVAADDGAPGLTSINKLAIGCLWRTGRSAFFEGEIGLIGVYAVGDNHAALEAALADHYGIALPGAVALAGEAALSLHAAGLASVDSGSFLHGATAIKLSASGRLSVGMEASAALTLQAAGALAVGKPLAGLSRLRVVTTGLLSGGGLRRRGLKPMRGFSTLWDPQQRLLAAHIVGPPTLRATVTLTLQATGALSVVKPVVGVAAVWLSATLRAPSVAAPGVGLKPMRGFSTLWDPQQRLLAEITKPELPGALTDRVSMVLGVSAALVVGKPLAGHADLVLSAAALVPATVALSGVATIRLRARHRLLQPGQPPIQFPSGPPDPLIPVYQVLVLSRNTGEVLHLFDTVGLEMRYSRQLNGVGSFVMTLDADQPWEQLFELDTFVEIRRSHPVTSEMVVEETYLTRLTHRFREADHDYFVVGGQSLNHLLWRRIVDPAADPQQAGGYSTKSGPAHTVMRAYAREQAGDLAPAERRIPELSIPVGQPGPRSVGARLRFENLLETLQDLARRGGVDFHIQRTVGRQLTLAIGPIGRDRTRTTNYMRGEMVYLSPLRGNLTEPSFELDRTQEQTFVYAQGQGQGSNRLLLEVPSHRIEDSPYNRIEFQIDASNTERGDALALFGEAIDALNERAPLETFSFTPTGSEAGNVYRRDWDVGDRVTVAWGAERDLRLTGIDIEVNESGERISVTVEQDAEAT